jgi:hypothetical protein
MRSANAPLPPPRQLLLVLLVACCGILLPQPAAGQRPARQTVAGPALGGEAPGDEELVFRLLRHQLKELIRSQDQVRLERGGFAMAFGNSDQALAFVPPPGVSVTFGYADSFGWTATASHAQLPGKTCVVWVGRVPPERRPTTRFDGNRGWDSEVVCDLVP